MAGSVRVPDLGARDALGGGHDEEGDVETRVDGDEEDDEIVGDVLADGAEDALDDEKDGELDGEERDAVEHVAVIAVLERVSA